MPFPANKRASCNETFLRLKLENKNQTDKAHNLNPKRKKRSPLTTGEKNTHQQNDRTKSWTMVNSVKCCCSTTCTG